MTDAVTADTPAAERKAPRPARSLAFLGQRFGLLVLFLLIIIGFSVVRPDQFPSIPNLRIITANQSVLAIVTLATILPLICGHFDLSLGVNLGASSILAASAMSNGLPLWLAILLAVALSTALGVLNGFMIARLGVNALIFTLGVGFIVYGLTIAFTHGGQQILAGIDSNLTDFGSGTLFGLPYVLYVLILLALFVWYLLEHTPYGRELHAVGANTLAARLVGIRVNRVVILSFVGAGALAGFAGVLQLSRQGSGIPTIGMSFQLPPLAAAFLGATTIHPGRFNVPGTLLAVFFLGTAVSGLELVGVDGWVEQVFDGAALVIAVTMSTVFGRRLAGL